MTRERVPPGTRYGDILAYSRAVTDGDDAWIAGCAPTDGAGALVGSGSAYEQARQCLRNISDALAASGFDTSDVVRTRIYLRSFSDFDEVARAHREVFEDTRPACTVVAVCDLAYADAVVYMDADARRRS